MITFSGLSHVFVPLFLPDTFVGGQRRDPSQQQPHALLDSLSADCSERPAAVAAGAQPGPGFWPQRPRKKEGFGGRTVESRGLRIDHYIYIYIYLSLSLCWSWFLSNIQTQNHTKRPQNRAGLLFVSAPVLSRPSAVPAGPAYRPDVSSVVSCLMTHRLRLGGAGHFESGHLHQSLGHLPLRTTWRLWRPDGEGGTWNGRANEVDGGYGGVGTEGRGRSDVKGFSSLYSFYCPLC